MLATMPAGPFGGRARLVAVSCAAACTVVVVSWRMRARRRAPVSLRASFASTLDAPTAARGNDCDAPEELASEFQARHLHGHAPFCNFLRGGVARTLQDVLPCRTCTALTSSACSCTASTSKRLLVCAPRRRQRGWTSSPTPSGAPLRALGPSALTAKRLTCVSRRSWQQVADLTKQSAMSAYISLVGALTGCQVCFTCGWQRAFLKTVLARVLLREQPRC